MSRMSTSPTSHRNWMLSSSMISPHRATNAVGISAPSAIVAELSSFPCIPTTVLNHIRRPCRPGKTRVSFLGPRIVLAPPFANHSTSIPSARALNTHTWPIRAKITVRYKSTICLRGGQSQQRKKEGVGSHAIFTLHVLQDKYIECISERIVRRRKIEHNLTTNLLYILAIGLLIIDSQFYY